MQEGNAFLILVGLATLAFAWVLMPFLGAVFWAVIIAIMFYPLFETLTRRLKGHSSVASLVTVLIVVLIVVLPLLLIAIAMIQEATSVLTTIQTDDTALQGLFNRVFAMLPNWMTSLLGWLGFSDLSAVQTSIAEAVSGWIGVIAPQVLSIGQSTVGFFVSLFAMLYLTFFFFRDGERLIGYIKKASPLRPGMQNALLARFTLVVRATVKGDILIAMLQGGLGGLGFWVLGIRATILWTVLMCFLSLLPMFGAALVWLPFAIYFLATGAIWEGAALLIYGLLVIGLVDNFVRPLLVSQATKMPEFVVLISTLGGVATFGLQGFITGPVIAAMFIAVWATFIGRDEV
ncbi:MAG: AI-2E family transporter [Rhodobacteraceae bacterium]|nr:AI-2E family transporter [Paracoccaceae bacterium]MCF8516163.1 AI-2E family transporter [Paracoccaceae bacterium]MCF8520434.1 AI-2E family transporter [Paracoccaceae bacterium]